MCTELPKELLGLDLQLPASKGDVLHVKCDQIVRLGDTSVTCVSGQTFRYDKMPYCGNLGESICKPRLLL